MRPIKEDIKTQIASVRAEFTARVDDVENRLRTGVQDLREQLQEVARDCVRTHHPYDPLEEVDLCIVAAGVPESLMTPEDTARDIVAATGAVAEVAKAKRSTPKEEYHKTCPVKICSAK